MMKFVKEKLPFFRRVKLVTTGSTGQVLSSIRLSVDTLVSSGPLGKCKIHNTFLLKMNHVDNN